MNFALFCEVAEGVELCLFDDDGASETRIDLPEVDGFVWHGYLPGVGPGSATATACTVPTTRRRGTGCNPSQAAARPLRQGDRGPGRLGTSRSSPTASTTPTKRNTRRQPGRHTMHSVVINPFFDWGNDRPATPYHETVIYEAHVKGLTMTHPDVPEEIRGTYAGSRTRRSSTTSRLGVTAVELMPVHQFVQDHHLRTRA